MEYGSSAERIAAELRTLVGSLPVGARLPPTRRLSARFTAGPATVQQAVRLLVREGLVESRPGAGNFTLPPRVVAVVDHSWQSAALGPLRGSGRIGSTVQPVAPDAIALHSGYPCDELLPVRAVQTALARAARSAAATGRPPGAGLPELRAWFAREVADRATAATVAPTAADVVVMPGGQSALASIFRSLARPGDRVVMESPTYWGAIAAARQAGLEVVPVPRNGEAVEPAVLDEALERSGARLFYAMPHFANPTGSTWSPAQARDLLEVVRARRAFLIEDDWAHDFALDVAVHPLVTQDPEGHVVHLRSLTKSVSPAIRVAAVIARGPALSRITADRVMDGLYVSGVLQTAALDVVEAPAWSSHLHRMRLRLRSRRDTLAGLVRELMPTGTLTALPPGGLNLWLRLPAGVAATRFVADCAAAGVVVSPGDEWFPAEPTGDFVRLNYSGPQPDRFAQAVAVMAGLLPG